MGSSQIHHELVDRFRIDVRSMQDSDSPQELRSGLLHEVKSFLPLMRVLGQHKVTLDCDERTETDFDLELDCSDNLQIRTIHTRGNSTSAWIVTPILTDGGDATVDSIIDGLFQELSSSAHQSLIIQKQCLQFDKSVVSERIEKLGRGVYYGGHISISASTRNEEQSALSPYKSCVSATLDPADAPEAPEIRVCWRVDWPFHGASDGPAHPNPRDAGEMIEVSIPREIGRPSDRTRAQTYMKVVHPGWDDTVQNTMLSQVHGIIKRGVYEKVGGSAMRRARKRADLKEIVTTETHENGQSRQFREFLWGTDQ